MADQYEDEDYQEDSKPKNGLRAQLESVLAEKKALETEIATLKGQVRTRTVADVLTAKGVNPKVAKFIPADVEGDDAIAKWLDENADVFGFTVGQETPTDTTPSVSAEDVSEAKRLQSLGQTSTPPSKVQDLEARMAGAASEKELQEIWAEAQKYFL